ncbi:MurR/RpiR family transcriptional regulator [Pseudooceanicola nitratireducens]|uniref:MurR/RpiR family transcriptional regulator n=1 Tax=Pseudooceanicola nitratireducens TaxID=517719 RepID=UPI0023F1898D|nr:MurR/RpiR family transcriptional regulator [Pseudooceanicola nitratireducens]
MPTSFEQRLAAQYGNLSVALRQAADFLRANPVEIATRPLRTVSRDSGVSPAAFSRLARALDYDTFDDLREEFRAHLGKRVGNFADRAERLQKDHAEGEGDFFAAHLAASRAGLSELEAKIDRARLGEVADRLAAARRVLLQGALGSTGVVEYLAYMATFHSDTWSLASRMGASLGSSLIGLDARDALIVVTMPPFATRSIKAAQLAHERGVFVVVITDTPSCPALQYAAARFIVPTESPHFYSSYVVTMFLLETLMGMVVARSDSASKTRIAEVEAANKSLSEVWGDT